MQEEKRPPLQQLFSAPGAAWRAKPFWSWNGELEKEELLRQVEIIRQMGWGGHFMHSRSGLATEYLGEEWFELINAVTDRTQQLGMESWLYDEDRWPSGSAGGKVTEDESLRMQSLLLTEHDPGAEVSAPRELGVWLAWLGEDDLSLWEAIPLPQGRLPEQLPAAPHEPGRWKVLCFGVQKDACSSNYNGTTYIDTMKEAATRRFIELTHEAYLAHCGQRIGTSIRGIFTDEPHRGHAMDDLAAAGGVRTCRMAWTDDLFDEYEKRFGADVRPLLPRLFYRWQGRAAEPARLHYFDLAQQLFLERFAKPLNDWCNAHNMLFTGHVLHEDSLTAQSVPQGSLMRFYEYEGLPGVDVLSEGNRCYWIVKQLASSARQLGKPWMLSELYGCTGWQFDFKGHKAVGDWQALLGINLRCPHLSWYTMEGQSKRDYPASLLHQSAWYPDYPLIEDYFARFGVLMQAQPLCDVLVLNPIESVWALAHAGWAKWLTPLEPMVLQLEESYQKLFCFLMGRHIDFDYGDEEMMSRLAAVERADDGTPLLRVGQMRYRVAVVGGMYTMRPSTLELLRRFAAAGGRVIFAGEAPAFVDAAPDEGPAALAARCVRVPFEGDALAAAVRQASACEVQVLRADGTPAQQVFVQVRRHEGGLYAAVLLNTDRELPCGALQLRVRLPGAERLQAQLWDMATGCRYDAGALRLAGDAGSVCMGLALPAGGTCALVFAPQPEALPPCPAQRLPVAAFQLPAQDYAYTLQEENVCVLDRVRWRWADGTWSDEAEVLKADDAIRDSLGIERRGGEMLQPWYSKLHHTECYGALELEYTFTVEELPADGVTLAAERPDVMHYSLNGVPLTAAEGFWVDICFKRLPIPAGALRLGRNVLRVHTDFTRNRNVEAVYLLGSFGVALHGSTAALCRPAQRLALGDLAGQGLPFFTGCLALHLPGSLWQAAAQALAACPGARAYLVPDAFHGALLRVEGPDGTARLGWEPFEADITTAVATGADVTLTLVGTRRNTFGPLHLVPAIQEAYGPAHFDSEGEHWSEDFVLLPSGVEGLRIEVRA